MLISASPTAFFTALSQLRQHKMVGSPHNQSFLQCVVVAVFPRLCPGGGDLLGLRPTIVGTYFLALGSEFFVLKRRVLPSGTVKKRR